MILNMNGGGAGLNFKVVSGTTKPENPTENMIWVNMETPVNEVVFSAAQPENPVSGTVWIKTGTSSSVSFNALKKDAIMIYPVSTKLFTSGWDSKEAKIYQNGDWHDFITLLIHNGIEQQTFTMYTGVNYQYKVNYTKTQNTNSIVYNLNSSNNGYGAYGLYYVELDLTGLETIQISASSVADALKGTNTLVALSNLPADTTREAIENSIVTSSLIGENMSTISINVSSLNGIHPIGIYTSTAGTVTLTVSDFSCT
jgi:hypothetical protein